MTSSAAAPRSRSIRTRRPLRLIAAAVTTLGVFGAFSSPSSAHADEASTAAPSVTEAPATVEAPAVPAVANPCSQAQTSATTLLQSGKLTEARMNLLYCSQSTCRDHEACRQGLEQVTARVAHVRFDAADRDGRTLTRVTVTLDGKTLTDGVGTDLTVDPGTHVFELRHASGAVQRREVTLAEGERGRRELVVLDAEESLPGEGRRLAGKVVTAGAGVALAAAVALTVVAAGTDSQCTQVPIVTGRHSVCSEQPRSFAPAAIAYATAATAGVVGIALWATVPSREGVSVGMGPWGLSGRF